jgi:hypothetical protein
MQVLQLPPIAKICRVSAVMSSIKSVFNKPAISIPYAMAKPAVQRHRRLSKLSRGLHPKQLFR